MKRVLITGGAGFIGSNLVKLVLSEYPDWEVVNLDALTYAGNLISLKEIERHPRYRFIKGDVADPQVVDEALTGCWGVLHLAAESHVDRSIEDPGPFLTTNVIGTSTLLDAARRHKVGKFVQVSTDEVYGSLKPDEPAFTEENNLRPNSPYSASKAAADLLARAWFKTYDLPAVITRCSNNVGPYQFPEKFIPLIFNNAQSDRPIPVYGDGQQIRDWIYVEDHCRALMSALEKGVPGEIYNIGGGNEVRNLDLARLMLKLTGKPESLIKFVTDRPGHDRRYAIDSAKIQRELGWQPRFNFEQALQKTVNWYQANEVWTKTVTSGEYLNYYERQYGNR